MIGIQQAMRRRMMAERSGGVPPGMHIEYTMDSISGTTLLDTSGNGRHATISGCSAVPGLVGNAIRADSRNGIITGTYSDFPAGARTVSFIAKTPSDAASARSEVLVYLTESATSGCLVLRYISGCFKIYDPNTILYSETAVPDETHHYAVVDTPSRMVVYRDGQTVYDANNVRLAGSGNLLSMLAYSLRTGYSLANGWIDQFRVYARALTQNEVLALYNDGRGI